MRPVKSPLDFKNKKKFKKKHIITQDKKTSSKNNYKNQISQSHVILKKGKKSILKCKDKKYSYKYQVLMIWKISENDQ